MKVCFAVDGTAISEGAFDCKFQKNPIKTMLASMMNASIPVSFF